MVVVGTGGAGRTGAGLVAAVAAAAVNIRADCPPPHAPSSYSQAMFVHAPRLGNTGSLA
jgi:hypothetical protein